MKQKFVSANTVVLIGVCPHCKESVEMKLTKREVKDIYHCFQMAPTTAMILSEKKLQIKYEKTPGIRLEDILGKLTADERKIIDQAVAIMHKVTQP